MVPCDLGDGIEVVHDVEAVEVEMDCALDDDEPAPPVPDDEVDEPGATTRFTRELNEELGTQQFERFSAPYERIEIRLDDGYVRATIEEAQSLSRRMSTAAAATATARRAARSHRRARTQS